MNKSEYFFREERLRLITEKLIQDKKVLVPDLAKYFSVSTSSIRNDLTELELRGLIMRTHGGAILPERMEERIVMRKTLLQLRDETNKAEKEAIGRAVSGLISDGDTIMIDGGSTTHFVAKNLGNVRRMIAITTSINIFQDLFNIPDAEIYMTGGLVNREFKEMIGEIATDAISRFHPSKTIIGIDGVSIKSGLTATNPSTAALKRKIVAISEHLIVVCDHIKFNQICLLPVATIESVHTLVTDANAPLEIIDEIRKHGVEVIVAPIN